MSLMPISRNEKGYQNLRNQYNSMTLDEKTCKPPFRVVYNRKNDGTSVEKTCGPCAFDEDSGCKFSFKATFECTFCNKYVKHKSFFDHCECGKYADISFAVLNLGVDVQAEFHLGVEKPDKSITRVSKETKRLLSNEKYLASFKLSDSNVKLKRKGGDFFSDDGTIAFVFAIAIEKINPEPELLLPEQRKYLGVHEKMSELFSEKYINADSPPDGLVDYTLYAGENKIYCHKLVLSISSGYFKQMFESNMKEAKENEVHLENIDLITLKSLLDYMYSGVVDESKITLELLEATDRFEVMHLRQICIEKLKETVTLENVGERWKTAYAHSIEDLTHCCVAFMARHWKTLVNDENILQLAKEHNELWITISLLLSQSCNCI